MATGRDVLASGQSQMRVTGTPAIPKMKLAVARRQPATASARQKSHQFETLVSLIKAFGEFKLLADSNGMIAGFWAARKARDRRLAIAPIGRPLKALLHPRLLSQIHELAQRTAVLNRREEVECSLKVRGSQRWFSVYAIPLSSPSGSASGLCLAARDVTHRIEEARTLKEREALLEQAEQLANFGSWEIDLRTNKIRLSPQLKKLYELAPNQKLPSETYWERIHPNDRMRIRKLVDTSVAEGRPFRYVARYCAPNGNVRVHLAHSLPLLVEGGKTVRAIGVIQDVTELAESHQELRRLSQQLLTEQDSQRRHLARELHESAGQSLAALKMTLGRLREAVAEGSKLTASLLDSASLLADGAVREVRTVSYLLHPPMLDDAGLGPALRWYIKGFMERSGISATLEISDPFPRYSQEIETTVFRVVQEALTNVHRYSGSPTVNILVQDVDSQLRVEIRDRGCGLPPAADPSNRRTKLGVGISGMSERVKQLDGAFELNSVPGEGATVRVVLPATPVKTTRKFVSSVESEETR